MGSTAFAADLPPPYVPPPRAPAAYVPIAPPPYSWGGFYIGGNLGAGWNSGGSVSDTFGSTFTGSGQTTKFLGGGQVGVNYEFYSGVVIGAEAMFDWLPNTTNTFNATKTASIIAAPGSKYRPLCDVEQSVVNDRDWQARLRMGPCVGLRQGRRCLGRSKQSQPYCQRGWRHTLSNNTTTNFGWTAGIGVEWAFAYSWSARVEYNFIGLQNQSITVPGTAGPGSAAFNGDTLNFNNRNISMLTAGLNYKFGGWW